MFTHQVVPLTGEIDAFTASTSCRVLDAIDGPSVIDLSAVDLLCAAGLTELVRVARRAGSGVVTLSGAQPHVLRVLEAVRFDSLFLIDSTNAP